MWRGAISFGMVAIPVRMYLATESHSVSFRLLCPEHHAPIRNKRFCSAEDHEIAWNDVVRGYEVGKDDFVEIDDRDLDNLPLPTAQTIEILEFVPDDEIEAGLYVKGAYYLEPESVGAKPYGLLRAALDKTGKVAIGKLALRDREHLCRIALHDGGIMLNTLHWPDEIRDTAELSIPHAEPQKRELDMAVMLVETLSAEFDPSRYTDEYRDALMQVVEAKLQDKPAPKAPKAEPAKVTDLMAALKASVEASRAARAERDGHEQTATAAKTQHTGRRRSTAHAGPEAAHSGGRRRKAS